MHERRPSEALVALGSLLLGAGLGGLVLIGSVLLLRINQTTSSASPGGVTGDPRFLAAATIVAFVIAAGVAFWRARVFGTRWQRVAIGVMSPTGAMFLAAMAMPIDAAFRETGIAVLAVASFGIAIAGLEIARRGDSRP